MSQAQIGVEPQLTTKNPVSLGLVAVFLITFLGSLITYGFNIAMPMIAADLKGMALYSWAISLPALAAALVTLLFRKLPDMYGRRAKLMASLAFFIIGAVTMLLSFLLILTIPEASMDIEVQDKKQVRQPALP